MQLFQWVGAMGLAIFPRAKAGSTAILFIAFLGAAVSLPSSAAAQQYASKERTNAALGHYARARTMLVQALAEFEQGRKYARPDMLLDSEEWRLSVISRTEELNRILDPRPRVTRDGVRFQANKLLIRRERDRLPSVADGAQDKNTYGEEQRRREMRSARARLEENSLSERPVAKKKSSKKVSAKADKSAATTDAKPLKESADDILFQEQDATKPAESAGLAEAGKAAAKATESGAGAPIIEGEEEEVDSRSPLPAESSERSLFGAPPAKPNTPAILDEDKKEEEVSKAIENALQERVQAEKPVQPRTEEEVLEDEITRQ